MKLSRSHRQSAFTLVEMMMSVGCGMLVLSALVVTGVALQRSFAAVEAYASSNDDQTRVEDYIAMDARRAISPPTWSSNVLTFTVPAYYNAGSSNVPCNPTLTSGVLQYNGGTTTTIAYSLSGSNLNRTVTVNGGTPTVTTIATNVTSFTASPNISGTNGGGSTLTYIDQSTANTVNYTTLSYSLTFAPAFTLHETAAATTGTTVYCRIYLRNANARGTSS